MSRVYTIFCIAFLLVAPTHSTAQQSAQDVILDLKPALDTQTVAILNVDLKRFEVGQISKQISSNIASPNHVRMLDQMAGSYENAFSKLQLAGATELSIVSKLGPFVASNRLAIIKCKNESAVDLVAKQLQELDGIFGANAQSTHRGDLVFVGAYLWRQDWHELAANPPSWYQMHTDQALKSLEDALSQAGDSPIRFAFSLSADQKRALIEMNPNSFAAGEIGSPASIEQLNWISLGIDPSSKRLSLHMETANSESAQAMVEKLNQSILAISASPTLRSNVPKLCDWLVSQKLNVKANSISLQLRDKSYDAMIKGIAESLFHQLNQRRYSQSIGQLRKMIRGVHDYLDAHGSFPPAYNISATGRPLLSWRVLILPYLNQRQLYEQFKLDEPWDSEHNLKVAEKIPDVYVGLPSDNLGIKTRFIAPFGHTTISRNGVTVPEVKDGTSSSIAIMEVRPDQAVIWTQPELFNAEQEGAKSKIIEDGATGFWTVFGDGSAHYLPREIEPETLKWLMLIDDGNVVNNLAAKPKRSAINFLPAFWFNELIQSTWVIGAIE